MSESSPKPQQTRLDTLQRLCSELPEDGHGLGRKRFTPAEVADVKALLSHADFSGLDDEALQYFYGEGVMLIEEYVETPVHTAELREKRKALQSEILTMLRAAKDRHRETL